MAHLLLSDKVLDRHGECIELGCRARATNWLRLKGEGLGPASDSSTGLGSHFTHLGPVFPTVKWKEE